MPRHLLLRLEAPLMSFGGDMVDAHGVVRDFPARSAITGLIANALGWERHEADRHDRLQRRLLIGSVRVREGRRIRDFQTAQLSAGDRGWTTRGHREGRAGGPSTYLSPHIRHRDADADALLLVALRVEPDAEPRAPDGPDPDDPGLDAIAVAIDRPERPLFLGRKPFLPATRLLMGLADAPDIRSALAHGLTLLEEAGRPAEKDGTARPRAQWPLGEGEADDVRIEALTDERNWRTGVHAGLRRVVEGRIGALPLSGGLHLVRLGLDPRALTAFAIARGVDDDDLGYAAHLALRGRYGGAAPQPFRLFREGPGAPHLLGYCSDPSALDAMAALPPPDFALDAIFPDRPASRPMPDRWHAGTRYAFDVRVRPVVRYGAARRAARSDAGRRGSGERDAFLAALEGADGPVDRETVYRAWLCRRFEGIAAIERAELRLMRRLRVRRSGHGKPVPRRIEGYEAQFAGTLAVGDGPAFAALLARGVGRHAAFGFGMLLLAPHAQASVTR